MTTEHIDAQPTPAPAPKKRRTLLVVAIIAVVVLAIGTTAAFAVNHFSAQQRKETLAAMKDERLAVLSDARSKIQPAVNAYLAAYKKARNAPASRDDAVKASTTEQEEFRKALEAGRAALADLGAGPGAEPDAVPVATRQLKESNEAYFTYMEGLVESYPQFEGLFRKDDAAGCDGLFVGSKANTLRERKTLLTQAATPCRQAAGELKKSRNVAYVEFARTFENQVEQLEAYAEVTAKGEESYNEFVKLKDDFVQKAADAQTRNAPTEEVLKIADDAKALNTKIRNNRNDFDYAAKRYLAGVKEMPDLVEKVFAEDVAAAIKYFGSVIPLREQILKDSIDMELAE